MVSKLKIAQAVCLTVNLWSDGQMRNFLRVTVHFIANWMSGVSSCKMMKRKHTAENIKAEFDDAVLYFGIAQKSIRPLLMELQKHENINPSLIRG